MCLHFPKTSNIEHRAVIKFFTRKGLNAIEISKELDNVYKNSALSYSTVAKWVAEFKDPERGFEDAPRMGRPFTITTDENIKAVERIVMRDRQISVRCVAYELTIPKTIIHEIMDNYMGMKKVCTRCRPKLLTPIQRANRVDCCQELLQQSEVNPTKSFDCIVTGDEFWIHHYDPLSQLEAKVWTRLGEQTPTRLRQERSAGKIMMIIFWNKDGVLLTEFLPCGTTINGPCYASIIEWLCSVIAEIGRSKVSREVLLFHDNALIHKCNIVQAAIRQVGFIELNHPVYSLDIAPTNYHPLSNLKKFLHGKNFSSDDEAVTTVEDHLTDLNSELFLIQAYKVCMTAADVWLLVKVSTFNKHDNCLSTVSQYMSCTNFPDNLILSMLTVIC